MLVVEDNVVNMEVTTAMLAAIGCQVQGVENGQLAVEKLEDVSSFRVNTEGPPVLVLQLEEKKDEPDADDAEGAALVDSAKQLQLRQLGPCQPLC